MLGLRLGLGLWLGLVLVHHFKLWYTRWVSQSKTDVKSRGCYDSGRYERSRARNLVTDKRNGRWEVLGLL